MTQRIRISVIVPTHHRPRLLERALESIKQQADTAACEVVVVSDVESAETDAVCSRLLQQPDIYVRRNGLAGPSESRNLGLQMARGNYLLFLDDDDAWHPSCLGQLLASASLALSNFVCFGSTVVTERRDPDSLMLLSQASVDWSSRLNEQIWIRNQVHLSSLAFPRRLLQGRTFDIYMRAYEDWEFLLGVLGQEFPVHLPFTGSVIYETDAQSLDRRGTSLQANDFNAVLDYLYVYRRHPAPTHALKAFRARLLAGFGLAIHESML